MLFFMFKIKIMDKIVKENGYVYLVERYNTNFQIYHNLGKDPEDERWADEVNELNEILNKDKQ